MNRVQTTFRVTAAWLGMIVLLAAAPPASATPLGITDTPLFLTTQRIYPNLILTLDDSLSMASAAGRGSTNSKYTTKRYYSAYYNALYYNPALTYTPPPKYNGTTCTFDSAPTSTCYPNQSFEGAWMNGFDETRGQNTAASSACNPLSIVNKTYSPVRLHDNYAATAGTLDYFNPSNPQGYTPDAHTQGCGRTEPETSGGSTTYSGETGQYTVNCRVDFLNNSSSRDRINIDTNNDACRATLFSILAPNGSVYTSRSGYTGPFTISDLTTGPNYQINFATNTWGSTAAISDQYYDLTPGNHCKINLVNSGSSDYIEMVSTNNACRSDFFTNLGADADLAVTVTSTGAVTHYTVTSANTGNWRIYVSNSLSSSSNLPVTMTWTRIVSLGTTTYKAFYYLYYSDAGYSTPPDAGCTGTDAQKKLLDACYVKVTVGSASDIAGKNTAVITANQKALQRAASATYPWSAVQQKQNFANWYSYYRARNLAAVSSTMRAFAGVDGKVRVGWQAVGDSSPTCNKLDGSSWCNGWDSTQTDNRVRRLDSTNAASPSNGRVHKKELYDWLARLPVAGSTYIRKSALRVGSLIGGTVNINHPYADDPGFQQYPVISGTTTSRTTYDGCRRNIHLIVTDGGWCGDSGSVSAGDQDSGTLTNIASSWAGDPTPTEWEPTYPYKDKQSETLADIAINQWATDLLSDTALPPKNNTAAEGENNTLSPIYRANVGDAQALWENPKNDPATWQHINTYTIAFGLGETLSGTPVSGSGTLPIWQGGTFASRPSDGAGYNWLADPAHYDQSCPNNTTSGTTSSAYCWPYVSDTASCPLGALDQQRKVYDLWHAAINGRGEFFSAESPQDLSDAVASVLGQAGAASSSFSALAANSTSLRSNTLLYQGKFDSRDWSGQLLAYPLGAGGVISNPIWDAALEIPAPASRNIYTYRDGAAASFSCAGSLQTALNLDQNGNTDNLCQERLDWLKGDHGDEERNGGTFRDRLHTAPDDADYDGDGLYWNPDKDQVTVSWVLGDIISSNPVYVQAQDYGYASLAGAEGSSYTTFLADHVNRPDMLYVGANDGMLHAFSADNGATGGTEQFAFMPSGVYANLSQLMYPGYTHLSFVDGSPAASDVYLNGYWKTVLVSGLGKGGKSVFALDVTEPSSFASTNPAMWEFTDADMGYSYSQPQIGRLKNGKWVAVFGNGYNSTTENAFLYIVNLEDPTDFKKLAVHISGCTTGCSNGLSTPVLFDSDNDSSVDYAYAGDLLGNMWRFDLNATDGSTVAADSGLVTSFSGAPLLTARSAVNGLQPITGRPVVTNAGGKRMVLFGTGRYLTLADNTSTSQQTLYGIEDAGSAISTLDRSELLQQSIITETTAYGLNVRTTTNNNLTTEKGWYLDLPVVSGEAAERVIDYGVIISDRIAFVTNIPSNDPCTPGGESWLIELGISNGARPAEAVLDINADSHFDSQDNVGGVPVSGVKLGVGLAKPPVVVSSPGEQANIKVMSGTLGIGGTAIGKGTLNYAPQSNQPATRVYWLQIQ